MKDYDSKHIDKKTQHIKRRRGHGLTYEKLGQEFGISKSTAHRKATGEKPMAKLTAKDKNAMKKSTFGLPSERKYPMPDKAHAANAKARATQQEKKGNLSSSQKAKIDAKANKILGNKHKETSEKVKSDRGDFTIRGS